MKAVPVHPCGLCSPPSPTLLPHCESALASASIRALHQHEAWPCLILQTIAERPAKSDTLHQNQCYGCLLDDASQVFHNDKQHWVGLTSGGLPSAGGSFDP